MSIRLRIGDCSSFEAQEALYAALVTTSWQCLGAGCDQNHPSWSRPRVMLAVSAILPANEYDPCLSSCRIYLH